MRTCQSATPRHRVLLHLRLLHLRAASSFVSAFRASLAGPEMLALAAAAAAAAAGCSGPADCSLAGACLSHPEPRRCVCDRGFTGPACSALDLSPRGATRAIAGLPHFPLGNTTISTVWGGHSARDEQGRSSHRRDCHSFCCTPPPF